MVNPAQTLLSTAGCGLLLAVLGGCVTNTIQEVRESASGLNLDESVVVLGRRHKGGDATEDKFVDCVSERLGRGKDGLGSSATTSSSIRCSLGSNPAPRR